MKCGECKNSRRNSRDGVYCRMFGIMIHKDHDGCRYHNERNNEGNDTGDRNELDAATNQETR